jgi:N-acetyl-anhydromuramyl-L-alanine amidase AmpD
VRVELAQTGFEHVLANAAASTGQKTRATIGKQRAVALLGTPGAGPLAIVKRAQWDAKQARPGGMTELKGQWSRITVHHSAETTTDPDGGTIEQSMATLRSIQKFHMEDAEHGWGDIGYHFLIDSGGRIFEGRDLHWQGAHAGGKNNVQNLGICLLGDLNRRPPSPAALESLKLLLDHLRQQYRIPGSRVYPHNELHTTVCPGTALTAWIKKYRK